jgi:hypothetical protein
MAATSACQAVTPRPGRGRRRRAHAPAFRRTCGGFCRHAHRLVRVLDEVMTAATCGARSRPRNVLIMHPRQHARSQVRILPGAQAFSQVRQHFKGAPRAAGYLVAIRFPQIKQHADGSGKATLDGEDTHYVPAVLPLLHPRDRDGLVGAVGVLWAHPAVPRKVGSGSIRVVFAKIDTV